MELRAAIQCETTVFGLFTSRSDLDVAIARLLDAGFRRDEIEWQEAVVQGRSLLTVHGPLVEPKAKTERWVRAAESILDRCGAESVARATEAGAASP